MAEGLELVRRVGGHRYLWNNRRYKQIADDFPEEVLEYIELNNSGIEAYADTVPLVTETALSYGTISGGAAVAVPSAILPTAAEVGAGIGVIGAATGIGLAIGVSSGAVLPGHKNIGPGNEPDPDGVDVDDNIAYAHDIRYGSAVDQQDIVDADSDAIASFDKDFSDTGNIHSVIGRTGLQIKKGVESYTGVLYPPNLPPRSISGKQWVFVAILLVMIHIRILDLLKRQESLVTDGGQELHTFGMLGIIIELGMACLELTHQHL